MDYQKVLKHSWNIVWRYRALWLFGTILALTTINGFYFVDRNIRPPLCIRTSRLLVARLTIPAKGNGYFPLVVRVQKATEFVGRD